MRNTLIAVLAVSLIASAAPIAGAQSRDQGNRDRDRGPRFEQRYSEYYRDRDATQAELATTDARLNRVYQRRITEAQLDDREQFRNRPRGWYSKEAALRSAERAWISYRDTDCRYIAQDAVSSRVYGDVLRSCLIDRTNERITILQDARTNLSQR